MIGQIQIVDLDDVCAARTRLDQARDHLLELADAMHPTTVRLGGGARDLIVRDLEHRTIGPMLVVHLVYDVRDVMGANTINSTVEALAPEIERLTGGRAVLRVLTNLADRRLARARIRVPFQALSRDGISGAEASRRIVECSALAEIDAYRAATHNKGIMNGIDAVALATGNDWRGIEAGAHAYAAQSGRYMPLSTWCLGETGDLVGKIELPLAVGIAGGTTRAHPQSAVALDILDVRSSQELAQVMASVGLAQNLAALRALAMEGIQRGHMALHARQLAMAAGAEGQMVSRVAQRLVAENNIRSTRAAALLNEIKAEDQA